MEGKPISESDFTIRQNDTTSPLAATLRDYAEAPVNLQSATVRFKMYPVTGGAAKVDAVATLVQVGDGSDGTKGKVSYSWTAPNTDTAGFFLGSWHVTYSGGTIQTFPNEGYVLVHVSPLAPTAAGTTYVKLEEFKSSASLVGTSYADADVSAALSAASRGVDGACSRRFWADADANQIRYYTPDTWRNVWIDDLITHTSTALDRDGDGVFETTWVLGTDFVLSPANAVADGKPYELIHARSRASAYLPRGIENSVKVTAKFGWSAIPDEVRQATTIIAARLVKRAREAPFGVFTPGGEAVFATRLARTDPDVANLLVDLRRTTPF